MCRNLNPKLVLNVFEKGPSRSCCHLQMSLVLKNVKSISCLSKQTEACTVPRNMKYPVDKTVSFLGLSQAFFCFFWTVQPGYSRRPNNIQFRLEHLIYTVAARCKMLCRFQNELGRPLVRDHSLVWCAFQFCRQNERMVSKSELSLTSPTLRSLYSDCKHVLDFIFFIREYSIHFTLNPVFHQLNNNISINYRLFTKLIVGASANMAH